jgi:hypothetical protein
VMQPLRGRCFYKKYAALGGTPALPASHRLEVRMPKGDAHYLLKAGIRAEYFEIGSELTKMAKCMDTLTAADVASKIKIE